MFAAVVNVYSEMPALLIITDVMSPLDGLVSDSAMTNRFESPCFFTVYCVDGLHGIIAVLPLEPVLYIADDPVADKIAFLYAPSNKFAVLTPTNSGIIGCVGEGFVYEYDLNTTSP